MNGKEVALFSKVGHLILNKVSEAMSPRGETSLGPVVYKMTED